MGTNRGGSIAAEDIQEFDVAGMADQSLAESATDAIHAPDGAEGSSSQYPVGAEGSSSQYSVGAEGSSSQYPVGAEGPSIQGLDGAAEVVSHAGGIPSGLNSNNTVAETLAEYGLSCSDYREILGHLQHNTNQSGNQLEIPVFVYIQPDDDGQSGSPDDPPNLEFQDDRNEYDIGYWDGSMDNEIINIFDNQQGNQADDF